MKTISKLTKIIAKICEVCHWVGMVLFLIMAIISAVSPSNLSMITDLGTTGANRNLTTYGFEMNVFDAAGNIDTTALTIFSIGAFIIMGLMAMVFRNVYLIVKKSDGTTPFQKDNVRMIKEIGIFSIAVPVVGLIMSTIAGVVIGFDIVDSSVNFGGFAIGLVMLCLMQFFARGVELESEVDGLL